MLFFKSAGIRPYVKEEFVILAKGAAILSNVEIAINLQGLISSGPVDTEVLRYAATVVILMLDVGNRPKEQELGIKTLIVLMVYRESYLL